MSFSHEIQQKIDRFAKEQSQQYLDAAEMTYIEKLRRKTGQTKQKAMKKLARFKGSSEQAREAQNDMILYMSDYMSDLMSKGMSEEAAFKKAQEELKTSDDGAIENIFSERLANYIMERDPADYEAVGLFYAGFLFIGLVIGALAGYIISGGRTEFLSGGWIDTLVGAGAGMFIGTGVGIISNAISVKSLKGKGN